MARTTRLTRVIYTRADEPIFYKDRHGKKHQIGKVVESMPNGLLVELICRHGLPYDQLCPKCFDSPDDEVT